MKRIFTFMAALMIAAMASAQNYGILITNTSQLIAAESAGTFLENESTPYEQYLAHVALSAGDRCKLYDLDNQTSWTVTLDEYSTSDIYLDQTNDEYVCTVGGCFDFYIKLRYNADKLYIGAGSGCTNGTTPQGNDPVGEDISQEEEPSFGICLTDSELYIWGQEEINPIVYDADGNFVSLLVLEEPEDGGTLYDMRPLPAGRYTMYLNDTTYLFDLGLQGPTSSSWDAATGCTIDSTTITVYMQQGETYLYGCERYTEPTDIQNSYTAVNECDSIVTVELRWAEEEPQPQEEEERRICLSHKKLMITELNNSIPVLLDSTGMQIEMTVEGYPMQNAIQYDLTNLPAGRYNLVIDTTSLLFDLGTETTTSYAQEGQDCLTYNSVINATIEPGQTYLFICSPKTEPGRYASILSSSTQCDSMVILNLSFVEEDTTCFNDTLLVEAVICEGERFEWRGEEFSEPGIYELTVQQHGGCDSVFIINLSVNPTYHIEEIVSVRQDSLPFIWHEQEISESGQYFAELSTVNGCDSIIALRLTVTELPIYSVTAIADHGFVNGTGTYPEGTTIHLEAVADEGFEFQMWSDGTTVNPKDFVVMQDTTLRALFYMPEVEQEVTIDSIETNSVTIIWDTVAGAVLYELRIYKNGQLVVTYQVDRDNNIISELFAGPDRLIARRDSTGGTSETLQVSVGGLDPGQDYTYSLDAMDDDRSYVGAQSGSFTTEEEELEGLDTLFDNRRNTPRKLIENGRLYIEMPDGTRYDACGIRLE